MLYISRKNIEDIGTDWNETINVISDTVNVMNSGDYSQPIKPYLRYKDISNRIIAMPAYKGGEDPISGIKWIASFPGNRKQGIDRAHATIILNDASTGVPISVLSGSLLSAIRTAGVSGSVIKEFVAAKEKQGTNKFSVGIVGFGPIGKTHADMVTSILGGKLTTLYLFDTGTITNIGVSEFTRSKVKVVSSWEEAYDKSDIFITCTVSKEGYIDRQPKEGSLQLNVSLRDYKPEMMHKVDLIAVDDWKECCRENTDIENMHSKYGLEESDTKSIIDIICNKTFDQLGANHVAMFNPMGMATFDMAIASYFYKRARKNNIGVELDD